LWYILKNALPFAKKEKKKGCYPKGQNLPAIAVTNL
jgi:hypothetical protein